MSDRYVCNMQDDLPLNITKIDVFFCKHEKWFHSMIFYGDTTKQIGNTLEMDEKSI